MSARAGLFDIYTDDARANREIEAHLAACLRPEMAPGHGMEAAAIRLELLLRCGQPLGRLRPGRL